MIVCSPSLSRRKALLKDICRRHERWKPRMAVTVALFVLSAGIMAADVVMLAVHPASTYGILIFLIVGACFACIPLLIALSVRSTSKYKCGLPYSSYANGSLLLSDDSLEYVYWRVGSGEPAAYSSPRAVYNEEDKFTYTISAADISSVKMKDGICGIKGAGQLRMPEWAAGGSGTTKQCREFSFLTAFDGDDEAEREIMEWMSRTVPAKSRKKETSL